VVIGSFVTWRQSYLELVGVRKTEIQIQVQNENPNEDEQRIRVGSVLIYVPPRAWPSRLTPYLTLRVGLNKLKKKLVERGKW
jgi:hypothetical protein